MSNKTTSTTTPLSGSGKVYSAQADNPHVKSVVQTETQSMVSIENTKKITNCMPHLGSTHLQGDEYSHKLIEENNEAVLEPIKLVVGKTQLEHQQEVVVANLQIQNDLKCKLPQHIVQLDSGKELNIRQEPLLKSAHKCFNDDLYEDNCLELMCTDDYMADDIDVIAESDDDENYETDIRRYVYVAAVPPAPVASPAEVAPVDSSAELAAVDSSAELAPVAPPAEVAPVDSSGELAPVAPPAEVAPVDSSAELAPVAPPAEVAPVDSSAELAPVDPHYRHYFACGIIVGLLSAIIIMKIVK
ncbi:unnamed protein product [Rotaria socialis]